MATGDLGESKILYELNRLRTKYPDHRIFPALIMVSNPPYDIGIDIDHHYYRGQVKTTGTITEKGRMRFDTSRHEKAEDGSIHKVPYTEDDIDFFLLYCEDDGTGEEWTGIALLKECNLSTTICKYGKLLKNSRRATDMDFQKRMRELIENKSITPLQSYPEIMETEIPEIKVPESTIKKPSETELFNLICEYGGMLECLAEDLRVTVPTIERWRDEYMYANTP